MFLEKFLQLFKKKPPKAIKVGLALGSGGAKGFAHIGALKAFEEHGVKFDVVAGTSIGSIVGAFYANGYSATDMLQLMRTVDFSDVKRLVMIRMNTDGVQRVLEKAIGDLEFSDLKLPFAAVATDFQTGQEVDLCRGCPALAPPAPIAFFKPVPVENRLLMDGAFVNSVPADLVRGMRRIRRGRDLSAFRKQNKTRTSEFFPNSKIVTGTLAQRLSQQRRHGEAGSQKLQGDAAFLCG
ncbi:MAG: patatin-like phospholipase family protein [Christensenellaceae bacterium]